MKKNKKIKLFIKIFAGTILIVFIFEGASMSLFSKEKEEVVLFSEMEGHITLDGKPAKNAKMERDIKWKDDVGKKDFIETDEEGFFVLSEIKVNAKLRALSQLVITQELSVIYNDKQYVIWSMGKLSKERFAELSGKPVNLRCELNDEAVRVEVENGLLGTSCKWDSIEK